MKESDVYMEGKKSLGQFINMFDQNKKVRRYGDENYVQQSIRHRRGSSLELCIRIAGIAAPKLLQHDMRQVWKPCGRPCR